MPRVGSEKQYNTFVKGLITEASPLTYPEQSFLDGANIVLFRDGSIRRRYGLEYESGYALVDTDQDPTGLTKSFHLWDFAGGTASLGVVQVGDRLWFMDMTSEAPSSNLKNGGDYLTVVGANAGIEATVVNNLFIIVSSEITDPVVLEYDTTTDEVVASSVVLQVRDVWGVDDGLGITERPATISVEHRYNLKNQGWAPSIQTASCGLDAIDCTKSSIGVYPSNADIWSVGKEANPTSGNFEKYAPGYLKRNSHNFMQAPRGRHIIKAYNRGASREAESGLVGLPQDADKGRCTTVTTYAGRVFYAGVKSEIVDGDKNSPTYNGTIFFSQVIKSVADAGKCYQESDPSGDISDLVATDGGTITIPAASRIVKIVPLNESLVVFAENGVWEIFGGDVGFKATEYQLAQLTNIGAKKKDSVVVANDLIAYWANNGIFILKKEQVSARLMAQNVSLNTIQQYYNELDTGFVKGYFEPKDNRIRWLTGSVGTSTCAILTETPEDGIPILTEAEIHLQPETCP